MYLVPSITSVLFYVGIEGQGGIDLMSKLSKKGLESPIRLEGDTPELGAFEIQIIDGIVDITIENHICLHVF